MVHRLRESKGLHTDEVKNLSAAWHHATRIGRPVNVLISLRPVGIDDLVPRERCRLFAEVRNKLGVYARCHKFPPTFVWSREINTKGIGEHMHVLMHVPARYRVHFEETVMGWYPCIGEIDVTTANQRTRISRSGKRLSAIGYISKQMTPQAWYKRGLVRKAGGPILGKRSGTTKNLDWHARTTFQEEWSTLYRPSRSQHLPNPRGQLIATG